MARYDGSALSVWKSTMHNSQRKNLSTLFRLANYGDQTMTDLYDATYMTLRSQLLQNKRLLELLDEMNKERNDLKEKIKVLEDLPTMLKDEMPSLFHNDNNCPNKEIVQKIRKGLKDMSLFSKAVKEKWEDSTYVPLDTVVKGLKEILGDKE